MFKQFAVEIKRTSYYTVYVEAETKDQAETIAWQEIENDIASERDADWECSDIYEHFATDETRANGLRGKP
jgi:hypothetical protein